MAKTITLTEDTFISGVYRASGYSASVSDDIAANLVAAGLATCSALDPVDTVKDLKLTDDKTCGTATLVAGTVDVPTSQVAADSIILVTCQTPGGTPGFLRVSAREAGVDFTILSSSNTDTSVVGWAIVKPS